MVLLYPLRRSETFFDLRGTMICSAFGRDEHRYGHTENPIGSAASPRVLWSIIDKLCHLGPLTAVCRRTWRPQLVQHCVCRSAKDNKHNVPAGASVGGRPPIQATRRQRCTARSLFPRNGRSSSWTLDRFGDDGTDGAAFSPTEWNEAHVAISLADHDLFAADPSREGRLDGAPIPPPAADGEPIVFWPASLTQRQRVLLHVLPLQDFKNSDSLRDHGAHYDTLALALKTFDVIIDHTGFGAQVNRDLLYQHLLPVLRAMDASAGIASDAARYGNTVDRVIAALRNDPARRHPFKVEYQDFDEMGKAIRRVLEFRLLTEEYGLDGSIVLVLTPEAINLYLRAFDLDIEDAQIANEAVVQSQIERGKFNEAIQSAQNARLQSIRYHDRIAKVLQQTRRDLDKVDWRRDMPELLAAALQHIDGRLNTERAILQAAEIRHDDLAPASEHVRALLEVIKLMRDCQHRHLTLHGQLMHARGDFLEQQARQSFAADTAVLPVDLLEGVLQPALGLPREAGSQLLEEMLPLLCGAQPRPAVSVKDLIEWHLRPRRPLPAMEVPVDDPDLAERGVDTLKFSPEVIEQAARSLLAIHDQVRLSQLLGDMQAQAIPLAPQELVVLHVLRAFAPEEGDGDTIRASLVADEALRVEGFYGDDLLIQNGGRSHAR